MASELRLEMQDGRVQSFTPGRLSHNLQLDAVSVFAEKRLALHSGDPIRWTTNDHARGLANSDVAKVESVGKHGITVSTKDGETIDLKHDDPMLERLDLAYAVNIAQGMTAKDGIMVLSESERMLNSTRSSLVAATRFTGDAILIVDDAHKIERDVARNPGDKTSAIEIARGQAVESEPDKRGPIMTDELRRLGAALGPEFVWAVLTNKKRELTLEKGLDRNVPRRGSGGRKLDRERDMVRGRTYPMPAHTLHASRGWLSYVLSQEVAPWPSSRFTTPRQTCPD